MALFFRTRTKSLACGFPNTRHTPHRFTRTSYTFRATSTPTPAGRLLATVPIELGGLAVLPGSHKINAVMEHHFSLGAGSLCIHTDELEGQWHSTDYEIGDTLIFPALTVHQALPNLTEDRLRVSLDNRYQKLGDTLSEHMLEPHLNIFNNLTWEDVYKDWKNDDLKYYWENQHNRVIPRDHSSFGERVC